MSIDLECKNITRHFGDFVAVNDISFEIPAGTFFSILGPSGCGKTTLLRMLAGFDEPGAGDILIKGKPMNGVPPNRRPVNMVFQHLALFPMMSVADNIAYGLKRHKIPRSEIGPKVQQALDKVNLPDAGEKRIDQLSGGQKQRIAIARCLVLEPSVLLLDEPLGALDLKLREHMKVELKQLQHQVGTTFVYITHDQSEALVMSDQVAVMNNGRFEQVGTPQQLYYLPETAFVADFVGDANRWRGTVTAAETANLGITTDQGLKLSCTGIDRDLATKSTVEIFVRPEAVSLSKNTIPNADNHLNCEVVELLFNGANSRAILRDLESNAELTATLPQTGEYVDLKPGEKIHAHWSAASSKCFPVRQ